MNVKITIEATPKEMADFAKELQNQPNKTIKYVTPKINLKSLSQKPTCESDKFDVENISRRIQECFREFGLL